MPLFVVRVHGDDLEKTTEVAQRLSDKGARPVGYPYSVPKHDALFFNVESKSSKGNLQNIAGDEATVSN